MNVVCINGKCCCVGRRLTVQVFDTNLYDNFADILTSIKS